MIARLSIKKKSPEQPAAQSSKNKLQQLRQQVILRLATAAGIAFGMMALYLSLQHWQESIETEKRTLQTRIGGLNAQISQLQDEYEKAKQSLQLYDSLQTKAKQGSMSLNREEIVQKISDLKKKHLIISLQMEISPVEQLKEEAFNRSTTRVSHMTMTLSFTAITDEYAMRFFDELTNTLPGYVRPEQIELKRDGKVNETYVRSLSAGTLTGLVSGRFLLHLLALEATPAKEASNATP